MMILILILLTIWTEQTIKIQFDPLDAALILILIFFFIVGMRMMIAAAPIKLQLQTLHLIIRIQRCGPHAHGLGMTVRSTDVMVVRRHYGTMMMILRAVHTAVALLWLLHATVVHRIICTVTVTACVEE